MLTEFDKRLRDGSKTVLDFIRNVAVVITIGVLADAVDSDALRTLYFVALVALIANGITYLPISRPDDFGFKTARRNRIAAGLLGLILFVPGSGLLIYRFTGAIQEAVRKERAHRVLSARPAGSAPCRFTLDLTGYRCL